MLMQPTLEKLYSMKLNGTAEAIRHEIEDPEASQLSFEERLSLLVDRQWEAAEQSAPPPDYECKVQNGRRCRGY